MGPMTYLTRRAGGVFYVQIRVTDHQAAATS